MNSILLKNNRSFKIISLVIIINFLTVVSLYLFYNHFDNRKFKIKIMIEANYEGYELESFHKTVLKSNKIINTMDVISSAIENQIAEKNKIIHFEIINLATKGNQNFKYVISTKTQPINPLDGTNIDQIAIKKLIQDIVLDHNKQLESSLLKLIKNVSLKKLYFEKKLNDESNSDLFKLQLNQKVIKFQSDITEMNYLLNLINFNKDLIINSFEEVISIKITSIASEKTIKELIELFFVYLIIINSIIFIFLKYYKVKKK